MEVYKRETREVVKRFLIHQLSFPSCIAALDAALAGVIPRLLPGQLNEVRAVMLANNNQVMEEMARRSLQKAQKDITTVAQQRYVDCKECGARITLQIHTGEAMPGDITGDILTCPTCLKGSTYSGEDFRTEKLF